MNLYYQELTIRSADKTDAKQLCDWWNDGKIMAHAGFPNGLGETPERIRERLMSNSDDTQRLHIIESSGKPIGEMHYRNNGGGVARIGIKICDFSEQDKGTGTVLLTMFIDALFRYYSYEKVILDTNVRNRRAQHVYENKLGFKRKGVTENAWRDQLGEWQSSINYELEKENWLSAHDRPLNYIHLRKESPSDFHAVESTTREAFWVNSRRACEECLLVHRLRKSQAFVPGLDFVAEISGALVGHIIYTESRIADSSGNSQKTLTFGPLSVLPEYQYKGVGTALLTHSIREARRLGYRAILIFGHPDYYPRFGFKRAAQFSITTPDGKTFDPFMALPLYKGALDEIQGRYYYDPVYDSLDEKDVLEFDKRFPEKEKHIPVPISALLDRLRPAARYAVQSLEQPYLENLRSKSEREISALNGIDEDAINTIKAVMMEHGYRWGKAK